MDANGNEDTNDAKKDTIDAEKEEVAVEEEEVKPGQEKGCRCLQSFALQCGQFQVPSPHQFIFF